jgi:hypothetical protein
MVNPKRPVPNFIYSKPVRGNWTMTYVTSAFAITEHEWTTLRVAIRRLMEHYFPAELKIGSDADKAKVWEKVKRIEHQYHHAFFSGCPPDFVKKAILGIAGKEQSERRSSASAVTARVPGPDAEPRGRHPRPATLSPVLSTLALVDRDLRSCSIVTHWSKAAYPAVIGVQELVRAEANFDIGAAQWDLYAEEVLVQFDDDALGEDKIYYAAPGGFRPVMNNATLRGALRWLKYGPSFTDIEFSFYRWSPEGMCTTLFAG